MSSSSERGSPVTPSYATTDEMCYRPGGWHVTAYGRTDVVPKAETQDSDPPDPQRILGELPAGERAAFLAAYRRAVDGARDPAPDWR